MSEVDNLKNKLGELEGRVNKLEEHVKSHERQQHHSH
jgi:hypothetical protein